VSTPVIVSHIEAAAEHLRQGREKNATRPAPMDRRNSLDARFAGMQQGLERLLRQARSISQAVQESQRASCRAARASANGGGGA